jgi:nicotinamide mononucleotide (NMN) deamidase PncC/nicotinic acid mononucleotide adenylyltransferase
MAEVSQDDLVHGIHDAGLRLVIAVTGGGSAAISTLLGVAGASRSVLAATVPYAEGALIEWLGARPEEFCSERTARAMAMAAFEKARRFDPAANVCGVGCTASLASDRPKRGLHRAHLAFQTATTTATLSLELEKGRRSRAEEEQVVAALVLNLMAEACGIAERLPLPLMARESPMENRVVAPQGQQDLLAGRTSALACGAARQDEIPRAIFPGAFNPLHAGHVRMAAVAREILGADVAYEISIANVDKPPLDFMEIDGRLRQFGQDDAVWLTRAPLFVEKAELFTGATFVVGADTVARIGHSRYYRDSEDAVERVVARLTALGCRFLVFGRVEGDRFLTLSDLALRPSLAAICQEVPEDAFRQDLSSTELRRREREATTTARG